MKKNNITEALPKTRSLLDSELISALYRGPLEPEPWRDFLRQLASKAGCENAALTLQLSRKGLASVTIWANRPLIGHEHARSVRDRHAALGDMDPLSNALKRTGEVLLLDEVAPREGLETDDFYTEVMQPFGIAQALGMYVCEPSGLECNLGLIAHDRDFVFEPWHKQLMHELRDHFAIGLELFSRIQRDETEIGALNDTLDRLTIATFILDGQGKILRQNGAAKAMLLGGETFRVGHEKLQIVGRSDSRRFGTAVKQALEARLDNPRKDFVCAFRCRDSENLDRGLLLRAIPPLRNSPIDHSPAVVVYASSSDGFGSLQELVSTLFDLTPSEAHLTALLTQGYSLAEAAEEARITESTARSYSKRIYAKVGVNRQSELVRLVLRSVAILG